MMMMNTIAREAGFGPARDAGVSASTSLAMPNEETVGSGDMVSKRTASVAGIAEAEKMAKINVLKKVAKASAANKDNGEAKTKTTPRQRIVASLLKIKRRCAADGKLTKQILRFVPGEKALVATVYETLGKIAQAIHDLPEDFKPTKGEKAEELLSKDQEVYIKLNMAKLYEGCFTGKIVVEEIRGAMVTVHDAKGQRAMVARKHIESKDQHAKAIERAAKKAEAAKETAATAQ
jgi:hypothetical protein